MNFEKMEDIFEFIKKQAASFEINVTKAYLILANVVLVVFAIWFSNVGLLPFKNLSDFAFFAGLSLILGLYRPGWTFVLFVGALALENINLAPKELGLALRPYQFFGLITIVALLVQSVTKRLAFSLPKLRWFDALPVIFALSGFLSSLGAASKGASFKQAVVALSFVALYFVVRIYVQSFGDAKRIVPFFLSSGAVVMIYSVWQNIRFLNGANSFEIMPGRPNGTFAEADWLGMYLVLLLAVIFVVIHQNQKKKSSLFAYWFSVAFVFVVLILTVSRSAWIGAFFVTLVFLKSMLLGKYIRFENRQQSKWASFVEILKMRYLRWKKFGMQSVYVLVALSVALIVSIPLTNFQIANRAVSTGGLQKITIACLADSAIKDGVTIQSVDELAQYGCKHINLEEIQQEKNAGNIVLEVNRPDPNVNIRVEIYQKSIAQIKENPILGLGWADIAAALGNDERGTGLNSSNIFLEVWLGSGLLGFVSFVILLGYILAVSIGAFLKNDKYENPGAVVFAMLGWAAIIIPNLFNAGIMLGFVWVYLGIAVGLLDEKKN